MSYVIIGASAAGLNAAKTLRELEPYANITIISKDKIIYSRSMIHFYLSGKRSLEDLNFVEKDFFKKYDIKWLGGQEVVGLNTYDNIVEYVDIEREKARPEGNLPHKFHIEYKKLLIATGASTRIPHNLSNLEDAENVFMLRNIEDADLIKNSIEKSKSAIVVGGGLIGVYLASELVKKGLKVSIVEYGNNVLGLQLDPEAARPYQAVLRRLGVRIHTNCLANSARAINNKFTALQLSNGLTINGDMLIFSTGIKPNTEFLDNTEILKDSGVVEIRGSLLREGILINQFGQTNIDNIFAAGDVCAERLGIWPLAVKEGIIAAYNMVGKEYKMETTYGLRNAMNFFGINTISLGDPNLEGPNCIHEVYRNGQVYKKIIHENNIIRSVILQGDISGAGVYEKLIRDEIDISHIKKSVFDIGFADFYNIDDKGRYYYK